MLVLGRKYGQTLHVDGPAAITILKSRRGVVMLGVEAPDATRIVRGEIKDKYPLDLQTKVADTGPR